jgi:hypothetical protein
MFNTGDGRRHLGRDDQVADKSYKADKKRAKAEVKKEKASAKAKKKSPMFSGDMPELKDLPAGVGITVRPAQNGSDLVLTGLGDEQLKRLLPQLSKEVVIAVAADKSALRAGMMRFVREGLFQTLIKVLAGLIVGYLLLEFGLR